MNYELQNRLLSENTCTQVTVIFMQKDIKHIF